MRFSSFRRINLEINLVKHYFPIKLIILLCIHPINVYTPVGLLGQISSLLIQLESSKSSLELRNLSSLSSMRDLSLSTSAREMRLSTDNMVWYLLFALFVTYSMLPLPLRWALGVGLSTSFLHLGLTTSSYILVRKMREFG